MFFFSLSGKFHLFFSSYETSSVSTMQKKKQSITSVVIIIIIIRGILNGLVADVQDCDIVVSLFEHCRAIRFTFRL